MKKKLLPTLCALMMCLMACDSNDPNKPDSTKIPDKAISVAENCYVMFSPGNLQYQPSTDTWRFAEHQYDVIKKRLEDTNYLYAGWIDFFEWGTGDIMTHDYHDSFIDWGVNKIGEDSANTWRTLSNEEWEYIFFDRKSADELFGMGKVAGVDGLILLPDNWLTPDGLSFIPSTSCSLRKREDYYTNYGEKDNFTHNTYTASEWLQMEAAGAIFLPAWNNVEATILDMMGFYWSSSYTQLPPEYYKYADYLYFGEEKLNISSINCEWSSSFAAVRLIKTIK